LGGHGGTSLCWAAADGGLSLACFGCAAWAGSGVVDLCNCGCDARATWIVCCGCAAWAAADAGAIPHGSNCDAGASSGGGTLLCGCDCGG